MIIYNVGKPVISKEAPVLKQLDDLCVFDLVYEGKGRAIIAEMCDCYYSVRIDKSDLLRLAAEITEFAENMPNESEH